MNTYRTLPALILSALAFAPATALAQEPMKPTEHHQVLGEMAGNWEGQWTITMPGMPPVKTTGSESSKLDLNGFWLMGEFRGDMMGQSFRGLSVVGWQPQEKKYVSYWIENLSPYMSVSYGTFDEKAKTFTSEGPMRDMTGQLSHYKMTDQMLPNGTRIMKMHQKNEKGEFMEVMSVDLKRTKGEAHDAGHGEEEHGEDHAKAAKGEHGKKGHDLSADAAIETVVQAGETPVPGKEHKGLAKLAGEWHVSMTMNMNGQEMQAEGVERNKMDLNGFWLLSEFKMDYMGMPFVGKQVKGYDPAEKKYVSCWIENMSPYGTLTKGDFDEKTKTFTAFGEMPTPDGKFANHRFVERWVDANTREATISQDMGGGKFEQKMSMIYTRK